MSLFLISFIPVLLLNALGRRIAGGLLSEWEHQDVGTQPQRAIWGLFAGTTALPAISHGWWLPLAIFAGTWIGSAAVGFWGSLTMGTKAGRTLLVDYLLMTVHGLGGSALAGAALWYAGLPLWWIVPASGLLWAPCYVIAWYVGYPNWPLLGVYNQPQHGLVTPGPFAELLSGGVYGVAILAAVTL